MKKILAFLLLLVLISPTVASACSCCHSASAAPVNQPAFDAAHHSCCPMMDANQSRCDVEKTESAAQTPHQESVTQVPSAQKSLHAYHLEKISWAGILSLPLVSSDTPLYLVHRILLI